MTLEILRVTLGDPPIYAESPLYPGGILTSFSLHHPEPPTSGRYTRTLQIFASLNELQAIIVHSQHAL